jgi:hypothetical protein
MVFPLALYGFTLAAYPEKPYLCTRINKQNVSPNKVYDYEEAIHHDADGHNGTRIHSLRR